MVLAIVCHLLLNVSFAQSNSDNLNYVIVDSENGFSESNWRRSNGKLSPTITAFNWIFKHKYVSAVNDTISKRYIFTLFVLPSKEQALPTWVLGKKDVIEKHLISTAELQNEVLWAIGNAGQYPAHTAMIYNIEPVIRREGNYYVTKNSVTAQCWEVVNRKIENPEEATPSTISTVAKIFSKNEIEQYRKAELEKMKAETKSQYPLGGKNIFADFVFLNERDTVNKTYRFWYKPAESFDGSHWEDGIVEFLYSPCVGIIGGSFDSYFRSLQIDPETHLMSKIRYGGFYRAYQIDNISTESYLKNCKTK